MPTLRSQEWVNDNVQRITNKKHITVMKNHITLNSVQTWVTKTVNRHST